MTEKVIVITTENEVSMRDLEVVNNSMLDGLQNIVGGYIEIVRPRGMESPLCFICDEEGLLKDKDINVFASFLYGTIDHGNPIVGDIVIMQEGYRCGEPDIVGIPDAACIEIYNQILDNFSFLKEADK